MPFAATPPSTNTEEVDRMAFVDGRYRSTGSGHLTRPREDAPVMVTRDSVNICEESEEKSYE